MIDGLFLTKRITGIERYAYEMVSALDKLLEADASGGQFTIEIIVPSWYKQKYLFHHIPVVRYGKKKGQMWEQLDLPVYLRKKRAEGIFLCNNVPLLYRRGILAIHDVILKAHPEYFRTLRDRASMWWHRVIYACAAHSDMRILTVSDFSKKEITKYYRVAPKRITVAYSAWQHMNQIKEPDSDDLTVRYPCAKKGQYYFSMSSLMPNKNFRWIIESAKQHPKQMYLIAGGLKLRESVSKTELDRLKNIEFLGYVSDEDAKALMRDCKAYISPTFYEGFGLTPLEAVASGCSRLVLSDIPVFHEVYGEFAEYVNPNAYKKEAWKKGMAQLPDVDFEQEEDNDYKRLELLDRYSWKKTAEILMKMIS